MITQDKKEKIKIFVAFSYDEEDKSLIKKIIDFIKKPEFGFDPYIVGEHKNVDFLDEQIQKNIHESAGIFAIFTKRYNALDAKNKKYILPPAMVISESSFAMGRKYSFSKKTCAGMYEKGINPEPRDIGLIVIRRLKLMEFERDKVLKSKSGYLREILAEYLIDFRKKLIEETERRSIHPYKQNSLDKTLYLYNNGTAIAEVHSKVTILDADEFKGIDHLIYLNVGNKSLPEFNKMIRNTPSEKPTKHFFATLIKSINDKRVNIPFNVKERIGREDKKIPLLFEFPSFDKLPVKSLKSEDIIEYEFAWGYPLLYKVENKHQDYYELRIQSTYGLLDSINLSLIVENGYKFRKEPFLTRSSSIEEHASFGREMKFQKTEESIIYTTFYYNENDFYGTVRAQWSTVI